MHGWRGHQPLGRTTTEPRGPASRARRRAAARRSVRIDSRQPASRADLESQMKSLLGGDRAAQEQILRMALDTNTDPARVRLIQTVLEAIRDKVDEKTGPRPST